MKRESTRSLSADDRVSTDDRAGTPRSGWVGDRYQVLRCLGIGSMGEVYLADDHRGRKHVALKFVPADLHHLLVREVGMAQRVSHPNVCRIYDLDTHEDQLFVTMEFVEGSTLREILGRGLGRLTFQERLRIAFGLCDGLAAIHDQHLLHRDLKPSNVMVDLDGRPVITDFGLAVPVHGMADQSGTPAYMAPEVLAGAPSSPQSDLYALGLVLFELFTDQEAFETGERSEAPAFPSEIDLPGAIQEILLECLDADPDRRPSSAREVAESLPDPVLERSGAERVVSPATLLVAPRLVPAPRFLWRCLWLFAVLWLLVAFLGPHVQPTADLVESPAALESVARRLLADQGIDPEPYRSWGFSRRDEDGEIVFWYHQSRLPPVVRPADTAYPSVDSRAPVSGRTSVQLDSRGRLLRFDAIRDERSSTEPFEFSSVAGRWTFSFWFVTVLVGTLFLAWRHHRDRSGDPTASLRLASVIFIGRFVAGLLGARHVVGLAEIHVVQSHLAWALHDAAIVWLLYLAVEPWARISQARGAASWVRLLYGRWRDPLVGRDLLVGGLVGTAVVAWAHLYALVLPWYSGEPASPRTWGPLAWQIGGMALDLPLEALRGARQSLGMLLLAAVLAALYALFAIAGSVVLARLVPVVSRAVVFVLLVALTFPAAGEPALDFFAAAVSSALWLGVLVRFGALAAVAATACAWVLMSHPLTIDPSSWYFGGSTLVLLVVAGVAVQGFRIAAGQFPRSARRRA